MASTPTDSHEDEKPVQAQVDHPTCSISTDFPALYDQEHNRSSEIPDSDSTEIDEEICSTSAPRSISIIRSAKSRDVTEKSSQGLSTLPVSSTVAPPSESLQTSRESEQNINRINHIGNKFSSLSGCVVQKKTKCRRSMFCFACS